MSTHQHQHQHHQQKCYTEDAFSHCKSWLFDREELENCMEKYLNMCDHNNTHRTSLLDLLRNKQK